MFSLLKNVASKLLEDGEKALSRINDKKSFERIVCAGFLIASADGDFDSSEKSALAKFVKRRLPQFDTKDIIKVIDECEERVSFDAKIGKGEILDIIGSAGNDEKEAIMRFVVFMGEADGSFDADEKLVARDIAVKMKVSTGDYGL